jgi:hypothetical protein
MSQPMSNQRGPALISSHLVISMAVGHIVADPTPSHVSACIMGPLRQDWKRIPTSKHSVYFDEFEAAMTSVFEHFADATCQLRLL